MTSDLAIIIPAYKERYLFRAIESLANQTSKRFTLYIGDDASTHDIKSICDQFSSRIDLRYHRFETNLGSTDLVGQWHRCVSLIGSEKWLWLFSDDDIADSNCVEQFYVALDHTESTYDVYRFNTVVVDADENFKSQAEPSPETENPMSLAYNTLYWRRGNSMPDHVFSSAKYRELNGFVNFPFAQGSDWASSVNFAYPKGLYTIAGPKIKWRQSGVNVSSVSSRKTEMIFGHLQFLDWMLNRFDQRDEQTFKLSLADIQKAAMFNLEAVFRAHYKGIPAKGFFMIARRIAEIFKLEYLQAIKICLGINYSIQKPRFRSAVKRILIPGGKP